VLTFSQQKYFSSLASIYCRKHNDTVEAPQLMVNNGGEPEARKLFA
jgi:hypothetical protein